MLRRHIRKQRSILKKEIEVLNVLEWLQRMWLLWLSFDLILRSFDSIVVWNEAVPTIMIVVYVATIMGNFLLMYCMHQMKRNCRIQIRNLKKRDKYYPIFH